MSEAETEIESTEPPEEVVEETAAAGVEDDADGEGEDGKKSRKLTPAEWAEIVEQWELGTVKSADIKAKYGISLQAIQQGLKKRGAVHGSRKHEVAAAAGAAATAAVATEVADFAEERRKKIEETKRDHYNWNTMIAKATVQTLVKAQREGKALGTTNPDLQALRHAAVILQRTREERYIILDAAGDVDQRALPDLTLRDLTDTEIEAMQIDPDAEIELEEAGETEEVIVEEGEDGGV